MKLKLNFPLTYGTKEHQPGDLVDLPDKKADWLLLQKFPVKTEEGREILMPAAERAGAES